MGKGKESLLDPGQYAGKPYLMNDDLEDWQTHELLALLRSDICRDHPENHARVKAILATRPNLPTKAQAKKARQERARTQKEGRGSRS